jgi:hypothetical protein
MTSILSEADARLLVAVVKNYLDPDFSTIARWIHVREIAEGDLIPALKTVFKGAEALPEPEINRIANAYRDWLRSRLPQVRTAL